jgi:hypothetical protein
MLVHIQYKYCIYGTECPHPPLEFMKMRKLREDLALIQVPYKVLFFLNTRIIQCTVLTLNKKINEYKKIALIKNGIYQW